MTTALTPLPSTDGRLRLAMGRDTIPHELDRPCTRCEETPFCQLLWHLPEYNRALRPIGLELREDVLHAVGDVRLVACGTYILFLDDNLTQLLCTSMTVLNRLLKQHRCVVAVQLNHDVTRFLHLHQALKHKSNLTTASILNTSGDRARSIPGAIELYASLNNIEELVLRNYQLEPTGYESSAFNMGFLILLLGDGRVSLRTLDVADVEMTDRETEKLIGVLMKKNTLKELRISFMSNRVGLASLFAEYLRMRNTALKVLTLRSFVKTPILQMLVKAIGTMTTLEELNADLWPSNVQDSVIFADVVAHSRSLRNLSVTWRGYSRQYPRLSRFKFPAEGGATTIQPWVSALSEQSVLSKLTLDLLWFGVDECCSLFRALGNNKSLVHINVRNLPLDGAIGMTCQTLQKAGLTNRVFIEGHHLTAADLPMLRNCPEVAAVEISCNNFPSLEVFSTAFAVVANCNHISLLRVYVRQEFFTGALQVAMAEYISGAPTLNHLDLYLTSRSFHPVDGQNVDYESPLIKALSSNINLRTVVLCLARLPLSDKDCLLLANGVIQSQKLYEMFFLSDLDVSNAAFLQGLASGIQRNYTLLCAFVSDGRERDAEQAALRNVIIRNCSLVARAAHFVLGYHDDFCARAIEAVSEHPKLVEIVQEQGGIGTAEAANMVRRAISHPCFTSLEGYMKLTSVVKYKVKCCNRHDAAIQLNSLDDYCWLHIRKLLRLEDILSA